jgi:hypothetical protein
MDYLIGSKRLIAHSKKSQQADKIEYQKKIDEVNVLTSN